MKLNIRGFVDQYGKKKHQKLTVKDYIKMQGKKIIHSEIKTEKITNTVAIAKCTIEKPIKSEITMTGKTEEIARQKLELSLQNKPYKHLE